MPVNLIPPSGPHYSSEQRLIDRYGLPAVTQACGGTLDDSLIDRKLTIADGRINAMYSGKLWTIPLVTASGSVPTVIADIADVLSWDQLYHARGINDRPVKKDGVDLENKFSAELRAAMNLVAQTMLYPDMLYDAVLDPNASLAILNI